MLIGDGEFLSLTERKLFSVIYEKAPKVQLTTDLF